MFLRRATIKRQRGGVIPRMHIQLYRAASQTGCRGPVYVNVPADSPVCTTLQHHGRLARPPWPPVHASTPAYNVEDNLLGRTGLQRRADSSVCSYG